MDKEVFYLAVVCSLLIVPRLLQRFRMPAPLTCLLLGVLVALSFPAGNGGIVHFAAVLGISSLFLYAGLEVNFSKMRRHAPALLLFALLRLATLAVVAGIASHYFNVPLQAALLIALALLTSSTGFILDSLDQLGIEGDERELVANEAILGEILALAIMFFVLQSGEPKGLILETAVLIALIAALPLVYYLLSRWIVSDTPESEFSLLVMVAIAAGYVTEQLGVEYLLGAFIAGLMASQMSKRLPLLESPDALHAVKLFSTFFLPFYFFRSGEQIANETFAPEAIVLGLLLCLLIPLRWLATWLRFRARSVAPGRESRLAMSLMPTLIFTLVLGQILRTQFAVGEEIIGGLIIYAFVNTLLPSLVFTKAPAADNAT